jgi:pimeloyl-ACP methyl ester carboxylesterase
MRSGSLEGIVQEKRVTAGGFDVRYYTAGQSGPPVVLLHGGGTDSALLSWREAIGPLAQAYRVYTPDWPGYGGSALPADGRVTQEVLLHCLDVLLDAWDLSQVTLVGVSMGGGASLGYALAHPERVARLVPVDSYGLQDKAPFHRISVLFVRMAWLNRMTWSMMRGSRAMVRWSLRSIVKSPDAPLDALTDEVMGMIQSRDVEQAWMSFQEDEADMRGMKTQYMARLDEIACPTLIVHGAQDTLVPLRFSREAAERIPNARLQIIERCGHWAPRDQPQTFNAALLDFLHETD